MGFHRARDLKRARRARSSSPTFSFSPLFFDRQKPKGPASSPPRHKHTTKEGGGRSALGPAGVAGVSCPGSCPAPSRTTRRHQAKPTRKAKGRREKKKPEEKNPRIFCDGRCASPLAFFFRRLFFFPPPLHGAPCQGTGARLTIPSATASAEQRVR
jgi:hypothetical protein